MAKLILLFSIFLITVTCSLNSKVPVNQKNACEILKYKRSWERAISKTEKKWGVSKGTQLSFILTESNFRPRAKTSRTYVFGIIPSGRLSSAYGYAQAIDSTWEWYQESSGNRYSSRTNFSDSVDFLGWYIDKSSSKLGIRRSDTYNQYLAYHQGHSGYSKGYYLQKPNLLTVALRTEKNARMFDKQLKSC